MDIDLARAWVQAITVAVGQHKDHLTQLDSAIGDADHGTNLDRGFTAAAAAVSDLNPDTVGAVLIKTGTTLISAIGGASGPLYGARSARWARPWTLLPPNRSRSPEHSPPVWKASRSWARPSPATRR